MDKATLKVEEIAGEFGLRYWVESKSDPEHPHVVDLSANQTWGQCSCRHWQCRIWPVVKDQNARKHSKQSTCKHVRAALHCWLGMALVAWVEASRQSHDAK